ncbi:prophage antirepressor-like protein [Clostridium algifaecis]|uniref:Prophage antirepressor-like protein n=1 Tax=Clostridium algifaecis TaxID=1472040 RepID=A0ABS4KRB6_9CLOT|nr:BRO family protein [Clostridium algifaecis]MBP2032581.1 prophage antirepressor-like protein [Clostridium algifaecis]
MKNQLQIFSNEMFKVSVKMKNGEMLFDAELVAKSLGISRIAKSGNEVVRWDRVNKYLSACPQVGTIKKGDFIPEPAVYKLSFKAHNDIAEKFQDWLAIEVLPQLRKAGFYSAEKAEQLKIEEPHEIVKKVYNGNPVMMLKDLESITNIPVHNLSYYLRNKDFIIGKDYFLLEGEKLKKFKKNNNVSPLIGNLIVILKSGVDKLVNLLAPNLSSKARKEIEDYFKVDNSTSHNKAPILDQLQACKFIADDLGINEAIKMSIYKMICEKNGIDSMILDKIEHNRNINKELKIASLRLMKYLLENNIADEIKSIEKECILGKEFASCSEKAKKFILNLFGYIIKNSKENIKAAI